MNVRWTFTAFDWIRFRALEAALPHAGETGDFAGKELAGAAELLANTDEETPPEEACGALIVMMCGGEERTVFETGLLDIIRQLRRLPDGEPPADMLGGLISTSPNIAPWFAGEGGPAGLLTAEGTRELAAAFAAFRGHWRRPAPPRSHAGLARRFAAAESNAELLEDLMRLVEEAAARRQGLMVLRED